MINKKENDKRAEELKKIADKYSLVDIHDNINHFLEENLKYQAHILIVGGFSAGKSALLNKYIGKPVLKESQAPETAYASELKFSENERISAVLENGTIEDVSDIHYTFESSEKISNLTYYIDSENIKLHHGYVLVDTPGFDSGLERHNQALMQYISKGIAYILVIDCERGTVSESALNFLNEVITYSEDIAVIITKCDKKIPSEIEKIKEYISKLLLANTGMELNVITTSIFDENVVEKMNHLIEDFDAQYLYDKNITNQLEYIKELLINSLSIIKRNSLCDTKELEAEIEKGEQAKEALLKNIEVKRKKIRSEVRINMKERIVSEVSVALDSQINALAKAALISPDMLQQRVIEIVRPILICHIDEYTEVSTLEFVKKINTSSFENVGHDIGVGHIVDTICEKVKDMTERKMLKIPDLGNVLSNVGKGETGKNMYRAITSALAITTSVIAPVLELVIVFLPDIMDLLRGIFSESKEEQITNAIRNEVIPQITFSLGSALDGPLQEVENQMIDGVVATIQELIETENQALQIAKDKMSNEVEKYNNLLLDIEKDIDLVRAI